MKRLLLLGVLALGGCLNIDGPATEHPTDPAVETFAPSTGVVLSEMTRTTNGVYYKDTAVGAGTLLSSAVTVRFDYVGYLKTGIIFDSGTSLQADLRGGVIPGLTEGMIGMRIGGKRKIVIPSRLGYGAQAIGGIPSNSTLVFDITLTAIP